MLLYLYNFMYNSFWYALSCVSCEIAIGRYKWWQSYFVLASHLDM